jgi:aspartate-semialdehyde dehydrogenase
VRRVVVVHPNTLIGRELRERLAPRRELTGELRLLSSIEDEIGQLAESGGEVTFVGRLDDDALEGVALAFFCGAIETDRAWLERLPAGVTAIVLSAGATLADGDTGPAAIAEAQHRGGRLLLPHPAAVGSALLLARLAPFGVRAANAVALLPVSTRGGAALDDLFEETKALLAFKTPKRSRSAAGQTAFNVALSAVDADEAARQTLAELGASFPFSLQLLEAGIFHGVALSLHVELERPADARAIRRDLAADPRFEIARKSAAVSPATLAGAEQMVIGEVRAGAGPRSFWIWAVYDNLTRGGAAAAIEIAERLLGGPASPPS